MLTTENYDRMVTKLEPLLEVARRNTTVTDDELLCILPAIPLPRHAERIGIVPPELRGLLLLRATLQKAAHEECDRQCQEMLGTPAYDNEHIEYMVYCKVAEDPQFAGADYVANHFSEEIAKRFPETVGSARQLFVIRLGPAWTLHRTGWVRNLRVDQATHPVLKW